jgi:hypothetical protein
VPECKSRFRANCVGIGSKIYIIGGVADPIDVYDIEENSYSSTQVTVGSRFAVAIVVEERIYLIHENRYKVLNRDFEVIEEGISSQSKYEILLISNVCYYEGKVYFFDSNAGVIDSFDVRSNKREARPIQVTRSY